MAAQWRAPEGEGKRDIYRARRGIRVPRMECRVQLSGLRIGRSNPLFVSIAESPLLPLPLFPLSLRGSADPISAPISDRCVLFGSARAASRAGSFFRREGDFHLGLLGCLDIRLTARSPWDTLYRSAVCGTLPGRDECEREGNDGIIDAARHGATVIAQVPRESADEGE